MLHIYEKSYNIPDRTTWFFLRYMVLISQIPWIEARGITPDPTNKSKRFMLRVDENGSEY